MNSETGLGVERVCVCVCVWGGGGGGHTEYNTEGKRKKPSDKKDKGRMQICLYPEKSSE